MLWIYIFISCIFCVKQWMKNEIQVMNRIEVGHYYCLKMLAKISVLNNFRVYLPTFVKFWKTIKERIPLRILCHHVLTRRLTELYQSAYVRLRNLLNVQFKDDCDVTSSILEFCVLQNGQKVMWLFFFKSSATDPPFWRWLQNMHLDYLLGQAWRNRMRIGLLYRGYTIRDW